MGKAGCGVCVPWWCTGLVLVVHVVVVAQLPLLVCTVHHDILPSSILGFLLQSFLILLKLSPRSETVDVPRSCLD